MKAKMFRSVDINEVPAELQKQLREVTETISKACASNTTTTHVMNLDMSNAANIDCVMESINNTRLLLSEIDKDLSEVASAITAFRDYVVKEAQKREHEKMLEQAMANREREQSAPVPVSDDDELAGPDVIDESPVSRDFMKKLAEMSNADKG